MTKTPRPLPGEDPAVGLIQLVAEQLGHVLADFGNTTIDVPYSHFNSDRVKCALTRVLVHSYVGKGTLVVELWAEDYIQHKAGDANLIKWYGSTSQQLISTSIYDPEFVGVIHAGIKAYLEGNL